MQVRVLFFGPLVERLGCREERLEMPAAAKAGDVYRHYFRREPAIGAWGRDLLVAVNEEFSSSDHPLREGDEIAFLPPMSGGSPETPAALAAEPSSCSPANPSSRLAGAKPSAAPNTAASSSSRAWRATTIKARR